MNFSISWDKVFKTTIYLLVFLIPLFFMPFTVDVLDFNKQLLFLFLIFLALLFFIFKVFKNNNLKINFNSLNLPVLIFLLAYGLSTIFSVFSYGSFWGWPLDASSGLLSLIILVVLYFLIVNTFNQKKDLFNLFSFLSLSGFFVSLINIFQLFGKYIFPWDFTRNIAFNTIGTPNSIAIFSAVLIPLLMSMFFVFKKKIKWFLLITIILMLFNLILINFKTAWIILTVGISLIFILGINISSNKNNRFILWPAVILTLSLFFVIAGSLIPNFTNLSYEVSLSNSSEISIAKEALLKSPVLGTGPGTFIYNYLMFKPQGINQTDYWNVVFKKNSSEIINKFITLGLLGILTFFFVVGTALLVGFNFLKQVVKKIENNTDLFLWLGIFSSFIALLLAQFLYHTNFTLSMLFWILLAGLISFIQIDKNSEKNIKGSSIISGLILLLILVFILLLSFIPKYIAETKFLKGIELSNQGKLEQAAENINEAIRFSPGVDLYYRELSLVYLKDLNNLLYNNELTEEEVELKYQNLVSRINDSTDKAIAINNKSAENWKNKGLIHSELVNLVLGSDELALNAYNKALELDPFNPEIFNRIGNIYIKKADLSQQENDKETNLKKAKENLEKSISLKNNYVESYFLLAMVLERQGETEKSAEILESLKKLFPNDLNLLFQLGVIYYSDNQLDQAKTIFEKLTESYLDARYYLGLIYEKQGDIEKAIAEFEKINELMPENETIKDILLNLRNGDPISDILEMNSEEYMMVE